MSSAKNIPWGPPKPRNAVLLGVFVLQAYPATEIDKTVLYVRTVALSESRAFNTEVREIISIPRVINSSG